jgi:rubrerythrin
MKNWLGYFEYNRVHRREVPWHKGVNVASRSRKMLIHSLQRFQVGESGEGRHLRKQAATTNDPVYMQTIDLFIKEEQEHARLMAEVLKQMEAPLIGHHWSDACFILLRRLFGLNQELLVLLMPEMIAKRYFRALRDGVDDPVVRAVCAQIVHDEEGHVAFHMEFLQRAFADLSIPSRLALRTAWRILFRASCLVVMWDHRGILREAGVSAAQFWWDCGLIFDEVSAGIFSHAPSRAFVGPAALLEAE